MQKIPLAISPIYQQNPGYLLFTYDLATGLPTDYAVTYLSNLDTASELVLSDWRPEYTFTAVYQLPRYSAGNIPSLMNEVAKGGEVADDYRRYYYVSHNPLSADDLPAYLCAIDHLDQASFTECYCGQ